MANVSIYKFCFQAPTLDYWEGDVIHYSSSANELLEQLSESENSIIICSLASKEDLLQLVSFYQKKKLALKDKNHIVILVDHQNNEKLTEAASRLSLHKIISSKQYFADEEEIVLKLVQEFEDNHQTNKANQTYEDLFSSSNKLVIKSNTKRRLYPIEEFTELAGETKKNELEVMTETPVAKLTLYEGEKAIESTLEDYFDREVILKTKVLPEDNQLILEFKISYLGEKKGLRLSAEVINIEVIDNEEYQVTLKVNSHLKELELMLKVFQKREQNIRNFLKKVRGI